MRLRRTSTKPYIATNCSPGGADCVNECKQLENLINKQQSTSRICLSVEAYTNPFGHTSPQQEVLSPLPQDISDRRQSSYQPGGTFMATTGKWATRSTGKMIEDPTGLGRWSGLTCFLGKRNKRLTILTAYQSPRQQPNTGFGFYDQQYALLLSKGVKKPARPQTIYHGHNYPKRPPKCWS